jgi:hypothetical protein
LGVKDRECVVLAARGGHALGLARENDLLARCVFGGAGPFGRAYRWVFKDGTHQVLSLCHLLLILCVRHVVMLLNESLLLVLRIDVIVLESLEAVAALTGIA